MAKRRDISQAVDELCTCGHLKSQHGGLIGHGACTICQCGRFTWNGWVYKETIVLREGDNALEKLKGSLKLKEMEQDVFIICVHVLKIRALRATCQIYFTEVKYT